MFKSFKNKELRVICTEDNVMYLLGMLRDKGYTWADGSGLNTFNPFYNDEETAYSDKVFIGAWDYSSIIWGDYPMDASDNEDYIPYSDFIDRLEGGM